jgi:CheY-like chemotaxis protein
MIDAKRQRLRVAVPREPIFLDGDPTRLAQVVGNLLDNASKYTPEGKGIWLTVRRGLSVALVRVRDEGIGIAPAMLPNVFDLFTQVDDSLDRTKGGLGIGLTLVRAIVELHGGRIRARSPGLDRGSCFLFQLPIARDPGARAERPSTRANGKAHQRRLILVDDNVDAVESLALVLTADGHEVRTAYDGETALRIAEAFRPELIILDIGLPGMDGYEVARRVRAHPDLRGAVLVALTGYGQPADRNRARAAGFDHHFIKPADFASLQKLLQ